MSSETIVERLNKVKHNDSAEWHAGLTYGTKQPYYVDDSGEYCLTQFEAEAVIEKYQREGKLPCE